MLPESKFISSSLLLSLEKNDGLHRLPLFFEYSWALLISPESEFLKANIEYIPAESQLDYNFEAMLELSRVDVMVPR
jgi:hypothetical protein